MLGLLGLQKVHKKQAWRTSICYVLSLTYEQMLDYFEHMNELKSKLKCCVLAVITVWGNLRRLLGDVYPIRLRDTVLIRLSFGWIMRPR